MMYPDIKDTDLKNTETKQHDDYVDPNNKDKKRKEGFCAILAKVLVCTTGILNSLTGVFIMATTLYALFGGHGFGRMSKGFSTVSVSIVCSLGFLIVFCSCGLIMAACCSAKPRFKMAVRVFSAFLAIVLLVELAAGVFSVWTLSVIATPGDKVGNVLADQMLARRNHVANETYVHCCVTVTPPYSGVNATLVDDMCMWPASAQLDDCGDSDIFVCVCEDGPEEYALFFGLFLQQHLLWIAAALTVSGVMLLAALIAACVLICQKKKSNGLLYTDEVKDNEVKDKKIVMKDKKIKNKRKKSNFDYDKFFHGTVNTVNCVK